MRGKYGITDRILESGLLDEPKSSRELAEALGFDDGSIRSALCTLYQKSKVSRDVTKNGHIYWIARIHWIWKTPISANPPKIFGERGRV